MFYRHTGQHYDDVLGHKLTEYDLESHIGVDMRIRGDLSTKTVDPITRTKTLADHLEEEFPDTTVLPIVHGDTNAAGVFPQAWAFATDQFVAYNEAGHDALLRERRGPRGVRRRPVRGRLDAQPRRTVPRTVRTSVGSAASIYHVAPVERNRQHLLNEGHPAESDGVERIPVVGNSTVDAIATKRDHDLEQSVFDIYPVLEERDDWIRVDIHRRANLLPKRFGSIVEGVVGLVEDGYNVDFVEMNATRKALENYGYRERLLDLARSERTSCVPVSGRNTPTSTSSSRRASVSPRTLTPGACRRNSTSSTRRCVSPPGSTRTARRP